MSYHINIKSFQTEISVKISTAKSLIGIPCTVALMSKVLFPSFQLLMRYVWSAQGFIENLGHFTLLELKKIQCLC